MIIRILYFVFLFNMYKYYSVHSLLQIDYDNIKIKNQKKEFIYYNSFINNISEKNHNKINKLDDIIIDIDKMSEYAIDKQLKINKILINKIYFIYYQLNIIAYKYSSSIDIREYRTLKKEFISAVYRNLYSSEVYINKQLEFNKLLVTEYKYLYNYLIEISYIFSRGGKYENDKILFLKSVNLNKQTELNKLLIKETNKIQQHIRDINGVFFISPKDWKD